MTAHPPSASTADLENELRGLVAGEVRFDSYSRAMYATDGSIYEMEPVGVVLPRTAGDVQAIIETCSRHGTWVLPRGGGTSPAEILKRMDKNNDGRLGVDELPQGMRSRFASMDSNGDQMVDAGELAAAMAKMKRPGRGGNGRERNGRGGNDGRVRGGD